MFTTSGCIYTPLRSVGWLEGEPLYHASLDVCRVSTAA